MFICNSLAIYTPHPHGLSGKCGPFFTRAQAGESALEIAAHTNKRGRFSGKERGLSRTGPMRGSRVNADNKMNASSSLAVAIPAARSTSGLLLLSLWALPWGRWILPANDHYTNEATTGWSSMPILFSRVVSRKHFKKSKKCKEENYKSKIKKKKPAW